MNSTYLGELVLASQAAYEDYVTDKTVNYTIGGDDLAFNYPVHIDAAHCGPRYYTIVNFPQGLVPDDKIAK